MVHKNYKWNISLEEGERLCLENIDDIISEQKNNSIELNELVFLLNSRTKIIKITNNKKNKNLVNFIKINFGGIRQFIDKSDCFEINDKNDKFLITKISDLNFVDLNDWVFVDDS